jgi:hypothetical protein
VLSVDLTVFFVVLFCGQIWVRLFCPCLPQPTSQSSRGAAQRFFTRARHDFVFVFRFPQRSPTRVLHFCGSASWISRPPVCASCQVWFSRSRSRLECADLFSSISFCGRIHLSFLVPVFWVLLPLIFVVTVFCFGLSASRFGRVHAGVNLRLQSVLFPAAKPQVLFLI